MLYSGRGNKIDEVKERKHALLHTLWTKAVGTDNYVKAEWIELEQLLMYPPTNIQCLAETEESAEASKS